MMSMTEAPVKNKYRMPDSTFEDIRYAMVVEYYGKNYAGSQIQPNQKTVQKEIEVALKTLLTRDVKTIFSGRTDRGVHSKGQVVHFDSLFELDLKKFHNALNGVLPEDISIRLIKKVDKNFHSQKSAEFRWYRYRIYNNPHRSAGMNGILHVRQELNISEMNKALSFLLGEQDFSSFKGSNTNNPAKVCVMQYAKCHRKGNVINIDLIADRFLYNMVRIIVGTLIKIGQGTFEAQHMQNVLSQKDRTAADMTADPDGLSLMYVGYGNKYNLYESINKEAQSNENILCKAS